MGIKIGQNIPGASVSWYLFGSVMDCILCTSSLECSEGRNNSSIREDASNDFSPILLGVNKSMPPIGAKSSKDSEYVYWTTWWHIEQRSLRPGKAWETMTLFDKSHVRVISSRRYPGHWCKFRLRSSSFGDLMRRSRELDDDNIDEFRRSSKHRPIDCKLWFVAPESRHHTSRRGFWLGFGLSIGFEQLGIASLSERFELLSSYTSNSRSGESSVDVQYFARKEMR